MPTYPRSSEGAKTEERLFAASRLTQWYHRTVGLSPSSAHRLLMTTPNILMPGAALGRYELLMPIAQGGMAAVWAARQMGSRGFEKTVAIKTMLPKLTDDPMFERMFLQEATLATRIQHPNVAQILDLGEHGELLYIVMEWVDGE